MQNDKLLPCPFCGSDRLYIAERNYFGRKFATVNCIECHISQTGDGFETREEAIELWNTRKPMERIVEQLEEVSFERYGNEGMGGELVVNFDDVVEIVKGGVDNG